MSTLRVSPGLVAATLFLAAGWMHAQEAMADAAGSTGAMSGGGRGDQILKKFDKNGDGRIDEDERADAQEMMLKERTDKQAAKAAVTGEDPAQLRARLLERFDTNKDGRLSEEERAAAQKFAEDRAANPAVAALRAEFMQRFDLNKNGKLDPDETAAVRKFVADRGAQAVPAIALRQNVLKRFDKNADGKIDDTEMTAAAAVLRPGLEIAIARGDRFDTDHNGVLSDAEWTAAQKHLQQWLNGESPLAEAGEGDRVSAGVNEAVQRRADRKQAAAAKKNQ